VAVGTNAALKGITAEQAEAAGLDLLFCNTYHLLLQPGAQAVDMAGGLHRFMGRRRPIITDSGGFQIFSLAHGTVFDEMHLKRRTQRKGNEAPAGGWVEKITEEGVTFRSYRDGSRIVLTPESCVEAQKQLGADIILPLDELPPYHVEDDRLRKSVAMSHRWMERSLRAHMSDRRQQAMYGIIHGGSNLQLRQESAAFITSLPFDGYALGGTLGRDRAEMEAILAPILRALPPGKPRHVLGIADDQSMGALATMGADTFDSCYPTRVARHGCAFTSSGRLRVLSAKVKRSFDAPLDVSCKCPTCASHSVGYLNHLMKAKEPLAGALLSLHNLHFMCSAMRQVREAILADEL